MVSNKNNLSSLQLCIFSSFIFLLIHQMVLLSLGGSTLADLQQALEDYLPVLLGLVKDGKPNFS